MGTVSGAPVTALRWLEVRPREGEFQVWVHDVEDVGNESWIDIYAFPYVQGEPPNEPAASFATPSDALAFAHANLGASSTRWVNQLVAQDEYSAFLRAGRCFALTPCGT